MRQIDANALAKLLSLEANAYRNNGDYARAEGIGNALWAIAHAPTVSGWVSVKDGMPDKPCGCLVFNIYGWRALDFWEGDGWAVSDENEITHWMTLPLGPEVDK